MDNINPIFSKIKKIFFVMATFSLVFYACSFSSKTINEEKSSDELKNSSITFDTIIDKLSTQTVDIAIDEEAPIKSFLILLLVLLLKYIIPIISVIVLIYIIGSAITSSSTYQIISSLLLIFSLIFYYSRNIASVLFKLPFFGNPLSEFILKFQYFVIDHIPEFEGINFFGKKLLVIQADHGYEISYWPIFFLFMGVIFRIIIDKYIKNQRLMTVSNEYWLFITTYVVIASITSYVINWSFFKIIFFSIAIVMLFAAGLLRVLSDLLTFFLKTIILFIQLLKIGTKWLALFLARVAKFIRNVVKRIRELYTIYIVEPIRKLYNSIKFRLDELEKKINKMLDREKIDD